MRRPLLALLVAALGGCSAPATLTVFVTPDAAGALDSFVDYLPGKLVKVQPAADPAGELAQRSGLRVALVSDLGCGDCFTIGALGEGAFEVHGGSLLGIQYGLAQLLEEGNFRFFHPRHTRAPETLSLPASSPDYGRMFTPEKKLRGLHLHTLHPLAAYFDFWEPSPAHLDGAKRVIDWLVKNRGNYLEWPALNDIVQDPATLAAWRSHTRAILDYAHARGITVGVGVELFHGGNLQNAYDLLTSDDLKSDTHAVLQARLGTLLQDLPFDKLSLSFGEFFGADPSVFVQQVDNTYDALEAVRPGMEMTALIHVGNAPSQHVQYMGKDLLYYFLVQYANPAIVPWIHTVMYYDLFEDTGGAYQHQDFSLHRQYLLDRLQKHERVAYFPESAYWITFDDAVPAYLPIYLYTRWLDLTDIDRASQMMGGDPLTEHVEFSSGWEWGYWQNDYAVLRSTFERFVQWQTPIEEMYAPYGEDGAKLAAQIEALATLQHDALIGQRLAPYIAGTDFLIDAGAASGIVSEPLRPSFARVAAMAPADRATFTTEVLDPLDHFAAGTLAIAKAIHALGIDPADPWFAEVRDGVDVDVARIQFIAALYRAAVVKADGGATDTLLAFADAALADAERTVKNRHAHLHDPDPSRLLTDGNNATVYQYGYLKEADTLCYWERDRAQARQAILNTNDPIPGCVIGF